MDYGKKRPWVEGEALPKPPTRTLDTPPASRAGLPANLPEGARLSSEVGG